MRRTVVLLAVACVAILLVLQGAPTIIAADPCFGLTAGPPENEPAPTAGGNVWEAGANKTAIENATVELYKCVSGSSVSQGTDSTSAGGYYEFDVDDGYHYYVDPWNSGPLAGMSPATGTEDPSDPVWVGPSTIVDFEFED